MSRRFEVLFVQKVDRGDPCERLTHIGGLHPDGSSWFITQETAISCIQEGIWTFYVRHGGHTDDVVIATDAAGDNYLTTADDGPVPSSLLSLQRVPA